MPKFSKSPDRPPSPSAHRRLTWKNVRGYILRMIHQHFSDWSAAAPNKLQKDSSERGLSEHITRPIMRSFLEHVSASFEYISKMRQTDATKQLSYDALLRKWACFPLHLHTRYIRGNRTGDIRTLVVDAIESDSTDIFGLSCFGDKIADRSTFRSTPTAFEETAHLSQRHHTTYGSRKTPTGTTLAHCLWRINTQHNPHTTYC